jgi:hypothetical protein
VSQSDELARKTIINQKCKFLIAIDDDGHKKMFHVEDFVGLNPAWLIIELAISPLGNTKDDMMNYVVKCCVSFFGIILYEDDSTTIAPIEITDDREDSYITEKKSAQDYKAYDHIRKQGTKAFHLEVAKSDTPFFKISCQPRAQNETGHQVLWQICQAHSHTGD